MTYFLSNALEDLRQSLDPENKDVLVHSNQFYEVMGQWSKKIAADSSDSESDFNRTPRYIFNKYIGFFCSLIIILNTFNKLLGYVNLQWFFSQLNVIDERELPYTHSTPRASIGDKLLRCKDLLNLSNVSGYSLSTSRVETNNTSN